MGVVDDPSGTAPRPLVVGCTHCGTRMEPGPSPYCCSGCEVAAAIVTGAGLARYYAERDAPAPRPAGGDFAWADLPVACGPEGDASMVLRVDGMTCVSCAWVTERVVQAVPGVMEARVSLASGRMTLRWDPARTDLGTLARRIAAIGYRPRPAGEAGASDRDLLIRAGVAAFLAANVMGLSAALYAGWFDGMDPRFATLFRHVALALVTPLVTWCATPFLAGAWAGLKHRILHVDLPVSIGILAMYGHGIWATWHGEDGWLDSLGMLVALLLIGRVLEQRGRRAAVEAAQALAGSIPGTARRVVSTPEGERIETVSAATLQRGDQVEVGTGEEVPADGRVIVAGGARFDASMLGTAAVRMAVLTGESAPVARRAGDPLVAGALVEEGALRMEVEAAGGETLLARMAKGLGEALDRPVPRELADRVAPAFTAATLVLAVLGFGGWWWASGSHEAARVGMAVLVVACPCALALSGPLATAVGLGAAVERGLLVRTGGALRTLARIDLVTVDKTGTLTHGVPLVHRADDDVLRIASGLERASAHPVARAVLREAARRGMALPTVVDPREVAGVGIEGMVDGVRYRLRAGGPGEVLLEEEVTLTQRHRGKEEEQEEGGEERRADTKVAGGRAADVERGAEPPCPKNAVWKLRGSLELRDVLRDDAARTVEALRTAGLPSGAAPRRVVLLTGDRAEVAQRIGASTRVDAVVAEMDPEAKAAWVRARQAEGRRVLFVGDGINDGMALVAADVGVAMGEGAAASVTVADAVVVGEGLAPVAAGLRVAWAVDRAVHAGAVRSVVYNLAAVAAALAGAVTPLVAAVLMPLSSLMVAWSALRVRRHIDGNG